jgi:glycosyltransferase involved in cell wall biosynthesis
VLRGAYSLVVPSQTLQRIALEQYRLPAAKVRLIVNGVDTGRFYPGGNAPLRRELGIPAGGVVFGTVGRLRGEKNLGLLLRAFARLRPIDSWLVIIGEGECGARWQTEAHSLGIAHRVVFAGSHPDPAPFYRLFDVFVMSSSTEQMPLSLLEAMSAGLPALCTNVGDSAAMLDAGTAPEIVPPGSVEDYANALHAFAGDSELRRRLGEKNRRLCLDRYSNQQMISRWLRLYREAAGRVSSK